MRCTLAAWRPVSWRAIAHFSWSMRRWASLFGLSTEQGAKTSVHLATSAQVAGVSGRYFVRRKEASSSPATRDESAARRLWAMVEKLTAA